MTSNNNSEHYSKHHFKTKRTQVYPEAIFLIVFSICVYFLSSHYDLFEIIVKLSAKYEYLQIDEILSVLIFLVFALFFCLIRRWKMLRIADDELIETNKYLVETLSEIKELKGIIPICSYCHKIRDDKESWHQMETYISRQTDALFSHSICPHCLEQQLEEIDSINSIFVEQKT